MKKLQKMSFYAEVAENLNKSGYEPFAAKKWNVPLIQRVIYRKSNDQVVLQEITRLAKEYKSKGYEIPSIINS